MKVNATAAFPCLRLINFISECIGRVFQFQSKVEPIARTHCSFYFGEQQKNFLASDKLADHLTSTDC